MTEQPPQYVGKSRRWQANVSVAARGPGRDPDYRGLGEPVGVYPKFTARLEYTSADIAFLSSHWRTAAYRAPVELHIDRYDCDHAAVVGGLREAQAFLEQASAEPDFDGGSLLFAYSGHGREGDGTLCLDDDTYFSAKDFIAACLDIQQSAPARGRLRLALLLDSCHSGAFLLRVLEAVLHEHDDKLVPDYLMASSMPDELSLEVPVLGHGLSTFCFSVRPVAPGSMIASGSGVGVTWGIAAGAEGCALVSGGRQNPIVYDAYELRVAGAVIPVYDGDDCTASPRSRSEWEADLHVARDGARALFARLRLGLSWSFSIGQEPEAG